MFSSSRVAVNLPVSFNINQGWVPFKLIGGYEFENLPPYIVKVRQIN